MHSPAVYPSEIKYRPGRIQSLDSEQEIVLKQCWATLLKYWGYEVDLSSDDIRNKHAFVASSIVHKKPAEPESAETDKKKKSRFFSRKQAPADAALPLSEGRALALRSKSLKYQPNVAPSPETRGVYRTIMQSHEDTEDTEDAASVESFETASDSLDGTLVDFTNNVTRRSTSRRSRNGSISRESFFAFMAKHDASATHHSLLDTVKNDLVDNFILRFVRARKNSYEETMKMLVKSLDWRKHEVAVDKLVREGDAPSVVSGKNPGFVKNFMVNKAFVRGQDRNQNPLFIFQSRKHFAADSSLAGTERFALLIIEWCRLFLREVNESVDLCSLMFDLSGFSMKNADNAPVKFLTSIFEAHYPESLGIVIVHNAPWIFSTVWSIIKNWLDPVVASKIHFTKDYADLKKFIEPKYIPEYLGGDDTRELVYNKPGPEHTKPVKKKDAQYYQLKQERDEIVLRIIETTKRWVCSTDGEISSRYLRDKIALSYDLSNNYLALDPYLRNPGIYDRDGTLKLRN